MAALPGTYIAVTTPKGDIYVVPYSAKFGFQCQQIWFKPLEELFGYLKNLAGSLSESKNPVISNVAGAVQSVGNITSGVKNILGKQFLNMSFNALAWKGEEPVSINIQLPFFMGMKDKWNAKEEVYTPIMNMMKETVPQISNNKLEISAPGPTGIDVYKAYGSQIFNYIGDIGKAIAESVSAVVGEAGTSVVQTMDNTWSFQVGYSKDGTEIHNKYIELSNLIVRSSSFSFATELDENNAPINGEINLVFSAQTIIVSTDFDTYLD